MARIIKHTGEPVPSLTRHSIVIKGAAYAEQKEIEALLQAAADNEDRIRVIAAQQQKASRERGLSDGIQIGQNEVSQLAFKIFSDRASECDQLQDSLKQIADEIVLKILGRPLTLPVEQQNQIRDKALQKIKARHKLKLQASTEEAIRDLVPSSLPIDFVLSPELAPHHVLVTTEVGSSTLFRSAE